MDQHFQPKPDQVDFRKARYCPVINCVIFHEGKILLTERNHQMRWYPGFWNGVSGFLDDKKTLPEKVKEELREEVGITAEHIKRIEQTGLFEQEDLEAEKVWIVHPVRVEVDTNKIHLNPAESASFEWVLPQDVRKKKLMHGFEQVLDSVLATHS